MFKIYDGRECFWQWDLNQKLIVTNPTVTEVHFCNKTDDCSLVVEVYSIDGVFVADVPNILLQNDWTIRAYAYTGNHTLVEKRFKVNARTKPADYIYTETEVKNFETLAEQVGYYKPVVDEEGNLTWEASKDTLPFAPGANIKGEPGKPGAKGDAFTYEDFTPAQLANLKGEKGDPGLQAIIAYTQAADLYYDLSARYNTELRADYTTTDYLDIVFGDGEYPEDFMSSLIFDSGEEPTGVGYSNSGIINWVGTDCTTVDGYSIFQPSANTHYEIVFSFNGKQFVGFVYGYVPAIAN